MPEVGGGLPAAGVGIGVDRRQRAALLVHSEECGRERVQGDGGDPGVPGLGSSHRLVERFGHGRKDLLRLQPGSALRVGLQAIVGPGADFRQGTPVHSPHLSP